MIYPAKMIGMTVSNTKNYKPDTGDDFNPSELEKQSSNDKDVKSFVL